MRNPMKDTQLQQKRQKKRNKIILANRNTLKSIRRNWASCYAGVHIDEQRLVRKALAFYNNHLYQQSKLIHCLEASLASDNKEQNV